MSNVQAFLEKLANNNNEDSVDGTLFKLAHQDSTIEAATRMSLVSEELLKIAQANDSELLAECAVGLDCVSRNFMTGLNKIAAENSSGAIIDMIETQDGLSKIASVMEAVAVESQDEYFAKLAAEVVDVNNELFDELADLASRDESVAEALSEFHDAE